MVQMGSRGRTVWLSLVLATMLLMLIAAPGRAAFGVVPGSYTASLSSNQAGGHGDLSLGFAFNTHPDPVVGSVPDEDGHSIVFNLPQGLVGNPQAVDQCRADYLTAHNYCPADTQVGVLRYTLAGFPLGYTPIYNMVAQNGRPAELGFENVKVAFLQVHILASVRTGSDYGITTTVPALPTDLRVLDNNATIWGVPTDSSHDSERGFAFFGAGGCLNPFTGPGGSCVSHAPPHPFLSNPTVCNTDEGVSFTADSWEHQGLFLPLLTDTPQQMIGCDKLPFAPRLSMAPVSSEAGEPSGYQVDLNVPQSDSPFVPATAHVKRVSVTLPEGVIVSPSAADGLQGCSDAQIGIDNSNEPTCPDASKIGTVEIRTPLLPDPIEGSVYQGTQTPTQLIRVFLVAEGHGVLIKLPGSVSLDPDTGQITSVFDNNPQLPFDSFSLHFKGGVRAPLANPRTCGTKTMTSAITAWAGQTVTGSSSFQVTKGGSSSCPPLGFTPDFHAGVSNPVGGSSSPFTLHVGRDDDDQQFRSVAVEFPRGLLAKVAGVPLCGAIDAAAGTCGAASRIGTVTTSAGPGSNPFFLQGRAYLTNGYNGGDFGLSIVVPAKAGPIDLGNVVVRASIDVRDDGSIRVLSDPVPRILQGIPLQVRSIQVDVDRSKFMVNPTNCDTTSVKGQISSLEGTVANVSSRFQLTGCGALPFKPRLSIAVGRKGHTTRGRSTPVTATLTQTPGQAGVKSVQVLLPLALNALLPVVEKACTMAEFHAGNCEKARAGSAVAVTPLLKDPLKGSVYFVKTAKKGALPNLVVALRGLVDIDLTGHITIPDNGQLGTDFAAVPDVPITKFTLSLTDGSHGPVGIVDNLCGAKARKQHVAITITGQNGKQVQSSPHLHIHGCTKK